MFDPPFPRQLLDVLGRPPSYPSGIRLHDAWQAIEALPAFVNVPWQHGSAQRVLLNSLTRLMEHRAVVLAGVPGPVELEMVYREIGFQHLPFWEIDPDRDVAIPQTDGGITYFDLRAFHPEQWAVVLARGGRLMEPGANERPGSQAKPPAIITRRRHRKDARHTSMREALEALHAEGQRFRSQKAAWQAVVQRLGLDEAAKGYSIESFGRACGDLLD